MRSGRLMIKRRVFAGNPTSTIARWTRDKDGSSCCGTRPVRQTHSNSSDGLPTVPFKNVVDKCGSNNKRPYHTLYHA